MVPTPARDGPPRRSDFRALFRWTLDEKAAESKKHKVAANWRFCGCKTALCACPVASVNPSGPLEAGLESWERKEFDVDGVVGDEEEGWRGSGELDR